jgi:hypothetical protein
MVEPWVAPQLPLQFIPGGPISNPTHPTLVPGVYSPVLLESCWLLSCTSCFIESLDTFRY